jgi:hypothetical protein
MALTGYVFIVGSPRTGTSLLRHILDSTKDVAICGETRFLGIPTVGMFLRRILLGVQANHFGGRTIHGLRREFARVGDLATNEGAEKVVDYIYDLDWTFLQWLPENIERGEFLRAVQATDRTDRALFELILTLYAAGKPICGEKTPAHLYYVPTLMEWFPNAKVIHMIRDPRAIYASRSRRRSRKRAKRLPELRKAARGAFLTLYVAASWLYSVRLHDQYRKLYPNNYIVCRYEDLIGDPKTHLERICDFVEIDFSEAMLRPSFRNSSFVPREEQIWGFDSTAIDRWRKHVHPLVNSWFVLWTRKHLLEFGYSL